MFVPLRTVQNRLQTHQCRGHATDPRGLFRDDWEKMPRPHGAPRMVVEDEENLADA